jgi:hypothetical protein
MKCTQDVCIKHSIQQNSLQILRSRHNHKLDGPLVPKDLIGPSTDAADGLDGSHAVVGDQNLFNDTTGRSAEFGDVGCHVVEATVEVLVVGGFTGRHCCFVVVYIGLDYSIDIVDARDPSLSLRMNSRSISLIP